jgi:hypothetical protein
MLENNLDLKQKEEERLKKIAELEKELNSSKIMFGGAQSLEVKEIWANDIKEKENELLILKNEKGGNPEQPIVSIKEEKGEKEVEPTPKPEEIDEEKEKPINISEILEKTAFTEEEKEEFKNNPVSFLKKDLEISERWLKNLNLENDPETKENLKKHTKDTRKALEKTKDKNFNTLHKIIDEAKKEEIPVEENPDTDKIISSVLNEEFNKEKTEENETKKEEIENIDIKNQELYNKKTMTQENTPTPNHMEFITFDDTEETPIAGENYSDILSTENQSRFSKMTEGAKNIANQAYEGLYKIPGVNRIVGKLEIGYNQLWADRHEEKAVGFKNKMDGLDLKNNALDEAKREIESVIKDLKEQNTPGVESLQLKSKVLDAQKTDLLNKKDKIQSKFESRENKNKLYINKRDAIADKLINRYEEKLNPMEKELERLQSCKDQADLQAAVMEVKHEDQLAKLQEIENKKTRIEEALRMAGTSENKIKKDAAIKTLNSLLEEGREKIRIEKQNISEKKYEIDQKTAKVDAKANPYRDKKDEFVRVKEGRPIKIDVPTRTREEFSSEKEEIQTHTRVEKQENTETYDNGASTSTGYENYNNTYEKTETEKNKGKMEIAFYLSNWNVYLPQVYDKNISNELINQNDFIKRTKLSGNYKLNSKNFKKIMLLYYKVKKIPTNKFNKHIEEFFKKIEITK